MSDLKRILCAALLALPFLAPAAEPEAVGAIIIDDIGYNTVSARRIAAMPWPLTCAVLPEAVASERAAQILADADKELMLHLPMQGRLGEAREPHVLNINMDRHHFRQEVLRQLDRFPRVVGINNHQGSVLTTRQQPMNWLMDELSTIENFYVVDSRTASDSLLQASAQHYQLPNSTRDVFLDHQRNEAYIARQVLEFVRVAKASGSAIAIGHPYPETLNVLEKALPYFESEGVRLLPVSQLIRWQMAQKSSEKEPDPTAVAARHRDTTVQ